MLKSPLVFFAAAILFATAADSQEGSQHPSPRRLESTQPQQHQGPSGQQTTPADPRGTEQTPLIVRPIKSKEEAAADAKERKEKAASDRINFGVAALVAVATFLQFCALVVIISTTRRQLRAYVFTEIGEDDKPDFTPDCIRIPLRGRNRGLTPAYRVSVWIGCEVLPFPLTEMPHRVLTEPFSYLDIGPTGQFALFGEIERSLTPTEHAGIIDGTKRIYLFGEIRYRDAFALWRGWRGERQPRYTRFRYMVAMIDGRPRGLLACTEGNTAN